MHIYIYIYIPYRQFPIGYCLLPMAYCMWPVAYCLGLLPTRCPRSTVHVWSDTLRTWKWSPTPKFVREMSLPRARAHPRPAWGPPGPGGPPGGQE